VTPVSLVHLPGCHNKLPALSCYLLAAEELATVIGVDQALHFPILGERDRWDPPNRLVSFFASAFLQPTRELDSDPSIVETVYTQSSGSRVIFSEVSSY
jgi:hypothetical protein